MKIKQLTRLVFTRNYKSLAPLFIMSLFSSVIFNLLLPNLNGEYFDELTRGAEHRLYTVLFYLLIVNAGGLVLSFFLSLLNSVAGSRVALKVNFEVIEHIQKTPLEYSNKINPVFVTQQVNNDSHVVTDFFLDFLIQGFVSLLILISTVVLMFKINILIGVLFLLAVPVYAVVYFMFKKPIYQSAYLMKNEQSQLFSQMNRQLSNIQLIKQQNWFKSLKQELLSHSASFMKGLIHNSRILNLASSANGLVMQLFNIAVLYIGAVSVVQGKMTIGEIVIVTSYVGSAVSSSRYFIDNFSKYQTIKASMDRLEEHLSVAPEMNNEAVLSTIDKVILKQVSFELNNVHILDGYDYVFTKGNIYAVTGYNGRGKSSFVNVITGLYQMYGGNIFFNDTNIRELDMYKLRGELIGIVEQNPYIVSNNFKENLTYGLTSLRDSELDLFIQSFKLEGKMTETQSQGEMLLSGGEAQKSSIIRTLLKKPQLLILDEPTSMLDKESTVCLLETLVRLKNEAIIIIVTHDSNVMDICDEIINLDTEHNQKKPQVYLASP
ncbi:ABC transporter ATP-binding protein [Paenibacillus sp. FSL L8-0470]|uniref:ABC transporter ATP-binding protein n=2 Tax=Paenibacillus TaxID=44249 RepID=UPI0030FA17B2